MGSVDGNCAIWLTPAKHFATTRDGIIVESPRAGGRYFISGSAFRMASGLDEVARARLTTWLIDRRLQGVSEPEVSTSVIENAGRLPAATVPARLDRLLRFLVTKTQRVGDQIRIIDGDDVALPLLAWSESITGGEARFLLTILNDNGWITRQVHAGGVNVTVLVGGYERMQELTERTSASTQGFVAMWFDITTDAVYEDGIAEAIRDARYAPMRIDRKQHNNKIDDEIIAEIRRSRFLVADFTHGDSGARGGVYYEAGFAHGLSIPVIFTIRADMIDRVHFDTRQYSHILWKEPVDLRKHLADRISATFGDGPLKPNS